MYDIIKNIGYINSDDIDNVKKLEWFKKNKDFRLKYFLKHFNLRHSKDDLNKIYQVLRPNINAIEKTEDEILDDKTNIPVPLEHIVEIQKYKFREPTNSILFDLSIFIGELLIKDFPSVVWDIERNFELVDYNYLIVKNKNNKERFCPLFPLETIAIQLYENNIKEDLKVTYEIWERHFNGKMPDYMALVESWLK